MDLNELLGIDADDPQDRHADYLVTSDERLLEELVKFRRERHLTQQDVAASMGIDKSGVSRIEGGERDLLLSTLRRYAMAIGAVIDHEVHAFADVDGAQRAREYFSEPSFSSRSRRGRGRTTHAVRADYRRSPAAQYEGERMNLSG